jgi:hypothetical protein
MTQKAGVAAGGRWTDQVSLGVLASSVPRDVIDDVVAACGRQAKRSDGMDAARAAIRIRSGYALARPCTAAVSASYCLDFT